MIDQLNLLQQQIKNLQEQIANLTDQERIRNTIFFDKDAITTTSNSHTVTFGAGGGSDTFTLPKAPDLYIRIYFRGTAYNVPVFKIT